MKILITTDLYKTSTNGVAVSVRNLSDELRKKGHDVRILTLSENKISYYNDSVYYISSFSLKKIYPNVRGTFGFKDPHITELIDWKPDVIHSQCEFFTFQFAESISKKTGAPIVHTYHTLYEQYSNYLFFGKALSSYLIRKLSKWRLKNTINIIVPSYKTEKILKSYGIDNPIHVVPTGISLEQHQQRLSPDARRELRNRYGISDNAFVLISLGRIGTEKSIDDLITCFACILEVNSGLILLIVGDGPARKDLENLTNSLDIEDKVIFTGAAAPHEVHRFYQLGDVFVSASTSETQGLTYIEAAANGLPLVCRRDSCLHGVIIDGVNGFEFDTPEEFEFQICTLRDNNEFRISASKHSEEIASGFDKYHFAESAEKIYQSMLLRCDNKHVGGNCVGEQVVDKRTSAKDVEKITYSVLFWLFMFGSIAGFIVEGAWCIIKKGHWENHSALVWGPFCIVYGIGAVAVHLLSNCLNKKKWPLQFLAFSLSGAIVEYFSSLFQEIVFGSVSWNYSNYWLNIGGRVSLKMTILWGGIGILFVRFIYPHLNRLLYKCRGHIAKAACMILTVFMVANLLVSSCAVLRWRKRINDIPASNKVEELLDKFYDDKTMTEIYSNMKFQ